MAYNTVCKPGGGSASSVSVPATLDDAKAAGVDGWVPQFDNQILGLSPPEHKIWPKDGGAVGPGMLAVVYVIGNNSRVKAVYADENGGGGSLAFVGPYRACTR